MTYDHANEYILLHSITLKNSKKFENIL